MREEMKGLVRDLVLESAENWSELLDGRYFDEPVVHFASGDDPLFEELKGIIGAWHRTPREAYEEVYGAGSWHGGTVISWVMPWSRALRDSHRPCREHPSVAWTFAYNIGSKLLQKQVRAGVIAELERLGHRGVAPTESAAFQMVETPEGKSSNWSERHVGYIAGLGTFGLNRGFISEKGMSVVLNSVVTDAVLTPDRRTARDHRANCLFFAGRGCGACIRRCPVEAISRDGHDKNRCMLFGYGPDAVRLAAERGVQGPAGCALCQVGVPCESRNPCNA